MRKTMKVALAAAAAATIALGTALPASANTGSASGYGCAAQFYNYTGSDYARSTANGGCGSLKVRHYYTVPGFSGYTGWVTGSTTVASTKSYPELSSSQHTYTIHGSTYTYNLPA